MLFVISAALLFLSLLMMTSAQLSGDFLHEDHRERLMVGARELLCLSLATLVFAFLL